MMRDMRHLAKRLGIVVVAVIVLVASSAEAQQAVRPPSQVQVNAAKTMFKRGLVILVEPNSSGGLSQVTLFGQMAAPQKTIYDVLADPNTMPAREPSMRNIKIKARRGNALTYTWRYGDLLTRIDGTMALALAPPQAVHMRSINGFGPGFMLFRLYPDGPNTTTVALAMNIDVTKSTNQIIRWLTNANPDFQQAWNVGYSVMAYRGVEQVAVKRAGGTVAAPNGQCGSGPLRPFTPAQVKGLRSLFQKGTVAIIESDAQGRVAQASLAQYVKAPPSKIQKALESPGQWGRFIKSLGIEDAQRTSKGHTFKMSFSFTAFTLTSEMAMTTRSDGADVTSPSGHLKRSLINFTHAADGSGSIMTATARFRFRQGGRILRRMIDDDPYFGHALNASSIAVIARSFKLRAEGRR